jgi:hypothetical protein
VIAVVIALAALTAAILVGRRLLPLVWPNPAYRAEMARRDAAALDLLTHLDDTEGDT